MELIKGKLQVQYDPTTRVYSGPVDCARKLVGSNVWCCRLFSLCRLTAGAIQDSKSWTNWAMERLGANSAVSQFLLGVVGFL